jgi:tRNA (cmo5U34)-methyltransferase
MSNFDRIAPFYDNLVKLVFGRSMHRAQTWFLKDIAQGSHVLILGGGTGWLLAELMALNPHCKVVYIDASLKMVQLAKKRMAGSNDIVFIHGTERSIPPDFTFDAIITHFYLDLFNAESCARIVKVIRASCHRTTLWLVCDFMKETWWQSVMLSVMYWFFKIVSNLNIKELPDWKQTIKENGFREISAKDFLRGFISSATFQIRDDGAENQRQV